MAKPSATGRVEPDPLHWVRGETQLPLGDTVSAPQANRPEGFRAHLMD